MLLKQHLRLGGGNHAIKQATLSLFFGSKFPDLPALKTFVGKSFPDLFNQGRQLQAMEVQLQGKFSEPDVVSSNAHIVDTLGFQAAYLADGVITRVLEFNNDPERVALSLHNMQYNRWADFLSLFERIVSESVQALNELTVLGLSLHYVDELEWTKPDEQLPVSLLYKPNSDYFPNLFFKNSIGEVTLTAAQEVKDLLFFDRLNISSNDNGRPVATISHNVVHQLTEGTSLSALIEQPSKLNHIFQAAHEHNKAVLREILQPEVLDIIGLVE